MNLEGSQTKQRVNLMKPAPSPITRLWPRRRRHMFGLLFPPSPTPIWPHVCPPPPDRGEVRSQMHCRTTTLLCLKFRVGKSLEARWPQYPMPCMEKGRKPPLLRPMSKKRARSRARVGKFRASHGKVQRRGGKRVREKSCRGKPGGEERGGQDCPVHT